jgi:hypothetical protein
MNSRQGETLLDYNDDDDQCKQGEVLPDNLRTITYSSSHESDNEDRL